MKKILRILCMVGILTIAQELSAQPFFGYQTIGVHTWYVGFHWDGEQPHLGVAVVRDADDVGHLGGDHEEATPRGADPEGTGENRTHARIIARGETAVKAG